MCIRDSLKGDQNDVRNLCKPWGVQLREKKRYRPMDTLKQELKIALTKRAKKLKSENEGSDSGAATEHTFGIKYRDEEDVKSQGSADSEDYYGPLA